MDNFLDDLKSNWKQEKAKTEPGLDAQALLSKAEVYKSSSIKFQYGNVLILSITLIFYIIFFYRFLLYGTLLSKIGFVIMSVPLLIRIVAEVISIAKGRKIKLDENALQHNEKLIQYTAFRKWMHGPVTFTIMGLYTLGYYFIMVQFSGLVPGWLIILMCVAYPVVAYLIIKQVRKGIKNEMEQLEKLSEYHKEMEGDL
jgi:hypothetical protein